MDKQTIALHVAPMADAAEDLAALFAAGDIARLGEHFGKEMGLVGGEPGGLC